MYILNIKNIKKMRKITLLIHILILSILAPISAQTEIETDSSSTIVKKKKAKVKISGLLQVHYLQKFNTNGDSLLDPNGFRILRARLRATGDINHFTSYELMFDARADENNYLRDAYVAFKLGRGQSLRFGQQKTQFGKDNTQSIAEMYVVNRSEMSDILCRGKNLRDAGLGWLGKTKINEHFRLENAITYTNTYGLNARGPYHFSWNKNVLGRVGISFKKGGYKSKAEKKLEKNTKDDDFSVHLGISGGKGKVLELGDSDIDPTDDYYINFKRIGFDIEINHPRFFAIAEYVKGPDELDDIIEDRIGYYFTLVGKTRWNIGPMFRIDGLDDDYRRTTAGIYYGKPKDQLRVLLNYEFRTFNESDDRLYLQVQVAF
jgi:hypothetical protein